MMFLRGSALYVSPNLPVVDSNDGSDSRVDKEDIAIGVDNVGRPAEGVKAESVLIHFNCSQNHSATEYDIVRTVLYSTCENVNIVHECFRQVSRFYFYLYL